MDELVIKFYRGLLRTGFEHAGSLENPTIFLDTTGEQVYICGQVSNNFLQLFINIDNDTIDDIKYLCMCDPTANVVVELLCSLVKGKTVTEVKTLSQEAFARALGSRGEEFLKRARGIIELLNRGLTRYESGNGSTVPGRPFVDKKG